VSQAASRVSRTSPAKRISRGWAARALHAFGWARTWPARIGLAGMVLMLSIVVLGPVFAPHSPTAILGVPLTGPSARFPLGTDFLGRDLLSRVLYGGRTVVLLAGVATIVGYLAGATVGLAAGYSRTVFDAVLMRAMDVLLAFPPVLLLLVLAAGYGANPVALIAGIALIHMPGIARILRAATQDASVHAYVEAAAARGERTPGILAREILPNIWPTIAADAGPRFTVSILLVAAINFLGLGIRPPTADWALMISENRIALSIQPLTIAVPAALIAVLTISVNLVADAFARSRGVSSAKLVRR
jgi:peptide/nickel transport system permease protein